MKFRRRAKHGTGSRASRRYRAWCRYHWNRCHSLSHLLPDFLGDIGKNSFERAAKYFIQAHESPVLAEGVFIERRVIDYHFVGQLLFDALEPFFLDLRPRA